MKNEDTWNFAQKYCGRLWYKSGLILLPFTFMGFIRVIGKDTDTVAAMGGIICFIQMIPLIGTIFPTEKALRKTFDKDGRRKSQF